MFQLEQLALLVGRMLVMLTEQYIELVKNCYDADAKSCLVLFDNKYGQIPATLSKTEYEQFKRETKSTKLIEDIYKLEKSEFKLKSNYTKGDRDVLLSFFRSKNDIYILDNGDGMDEPTIRNHWMMIGTSNKLDAFRTDDGRIKTGAKGIGRFALDRLGKKCEMFTLPKGKRTGYEWKVDWSHFEGQDINLNEVKANLSEIINLDLKSKVENLLKELRIENPSLCKEFSHGTLIKISDLNDDWGDDSVAKVYQERAKIPLQGLNPLVLNPSGPH